MTKFVDSLGLKRLVTKIAEAVGNGTWLPVRKGHGEGSVVVGEGHALGDYSYAEGASQAIGASSHAEATSTAKGDGSHAEGSDTTASGGDSHSEGNNTTASGEYSHAEGLGTEAKGDGSHAEGEGSIAEGGNSHAEGQDTEAKGYGSHAEGGGTQVSGAYSHAQGSYNYNDPSFIDMVGIGRYSSDNNHIRKNAVVVYVKLDEQNDIVPSDPKNGYQYLIGVGGYQGQDIAEGMKSVQEVIADLEKRVAATETMTVEEIREIMSA